jgi:hypothetical protein
VTPPILEKIKSRGHWRILVRPSRFIKERLETLQACEALIQKCQVAYRGWYFPHAREIVRRLDYIEESVSFRGINETWRLYQSANFIFYRGLTEDWVAVERKSEPSFKPGEALSILSALYQVSEAFEFAARMAQAGVLDEETSLTIDLIGTTGRRLVFWGEPRLLFREYVCREPELPYTYGLCTRELIGSSRETALKHFLWLMERFGFDASPDVFRADQEKFFREQF